VVNPYFKFNKVFGLKLKDRLDGTYYSLLILSITCSSLIVLYFASINYASLQKKADKLIKSRYKEFVTQLITEEPLTSLQEKKQPAFTSALTSLQKAQLQKKAQIKKTTRTADKYASSSGKSGRKTAKDIYKDLPDVNDYTGKIDDMDDIALTRPKTSWPGGKNYRAQTDINNYDAGTLDQPMRTPFNYVIRRKGEVYINFTKELVNGPQERNGYRDPIEIEKVVDKYQPMIEYCFKKEARYNAGLKGYIKVAFSISYEGYVIPESIRILNSTLRSRKVEQCVKNYIRRWTSFARLDESMGIARVVQKFIFN